MVENPKDVEAQRGPGILMADHLPLPSRFDTRAEIGLAVHLHQTVGTITRHAEQTARPMVLKAAGEGAHTGRVECGRDALSRERLNTSTLEGERKRLIWVGNC